MATKNPADALETGERNGSRACSYHGGKRRVSVASMDMMHAMYRSGSISVDDLVPDIRFGPRFTDMEWLRMAGIYASAVLELERLGMAESEDRRTYQLTEEGREYAEESDMHKMNDAPSVEIAKALGN